MSFLASPLVMLQSVYKCDFLQLKIEGADKEPSSFCCCSCAAGAKYGNNERAQLDSPAARNCSGGEAWNASHGEIPLTDPSAVMSPTSNPCRHSGIGLSFIQHYLHGTEVVQLPLGSFHVVVFSLFLSYFPSPEQRWTCCKKAHQLLAINGLLLIITPDSSHQNRNAHMVKSWKLALESIGFVRWCYVKETHLHCMAFQKIAPCHQQECGNATAEMLFIPQDYHEDEEDNLFVCAPRTEQENLEMCDFFSELPGSDD